MNTIKNKMQGITAGQDRAERKTLNRQGHEGQNSRDACMRCAYLSNWIVGRRHDRITLWTAGSTAQQAAAPQTARQALLEMFFSKTQGTFVKHLPLATRTALENSGAMASLQQYSLLASQLQSQGQNFQTFETG